ncbi:hypothetical protein SAMN05421784_107110 [Xenorhabdus koppenhoeferi]|uniref:Uncharacterized protein n=1 Tax=Xenorhabdus koppenhoeferi TaxID=351659 RepID=A0A1I7GB20_9GAMM|nr:hypothetical protein SAMN05421784_107110 [Xenorhabdus koppenhoeferi]
MRVITIAVERITADINKSINPILIEKESINKSSLPILFK